MIPLMLPISLVVSTFTTSCLPLGKKVTSGYRPTEAALAFLENDFTTRKEVLSTLGQPTYTTEDERVCVYVWGKSQQWFGPTELISWEFDASGDLDPTGKWGVLEGAENYYGLFIEFNSDSQVIAHDTRSFRPPVEKACNTWREVVINSPESPGK